MSADYPKRLMRHYFKACGLDVSGDMGAELDDMVDAIIDEAVLRTLHNLGKLVVSIDPATGEMEQVVEEKEK